MSMSDSSINIIQFSNKSSQDKKLLREFVDFHWSHYREEPRFIPLLDYEFLGFKLLGVTGYFEPHHLFFKHGRMSFFLARRNGETVGRTCAFVNDDHNRHHKDKVGFFGFFESINDQAVTNALLSAAGQYLKSEGMTAMRGPQNLPVNEATPGVLIEGFDAMPIIYYHFNYPYYADLLQQNGMTVIKNVVGIDMPVNTPVEERFIRMSEKVKKRYDITIETFSRKRFKVLREFMFDIYNEAWENNWGFVPVSREEFYKNLDDMKLIWDPKMFLFAFVKGEPAAFFGSIPNIAENMKPLSLLPRAELLRALKTIMKSKKVKSFRQGYFGIKPKFRRMGLDSILISQAKYYAQQQKYQYCDVGWVLEDNELVLRMADFMGGAINRKYAIFQKDL
jgi:GNAT superfamily N-acetyltransferase